MENLRLYDFDTGAETSTQPDSGTPTNPNDITTKSYVDLFGRLITGSWNTPQTITAGGGIAFTGSYRNNTWFVKAASAVDLSANPQIADGTVDGQRICLIYSDSSNSILLENGNGLIMNGPFNMIQGSAIEFEWSSEADAWIEISRNGIEAA